MQIDTFVHSCQGTIPGRGQCPETTTENVQMGVWRCPEHQQPTATVAHRCALCREPIALDPGVSTAAQIDQRIAAHHAVCPKRPIAVGDLVFLDVSGPQFVESWQEGTVESLGEDGYARVRLSRAGSDMRSEIGCVRRLWLKSLRRIPRPAEAQATVVRTPVGDIKITADPTLKPGEFVVKRPKYRPIVVDREAMERAEKDEKLMQRLQDENEKRITWLATGGTKSGTLAPAAERYMPDPALIDGLDREQCLARWMENRLAVEGGAVPPNAMTRMQRDVARALWLERYGALRGDALRTKVVAGREAERNRVTYCEVDPCD